MEHIAQAEADGYNFGLASSGTHGANPALYRSTGCDPLGDFDAVATRFQADRDLVVIAGAQGSRLDPSTEDGFGAKMRLDATRPLGAPEMRFKRIAVPGQAAIRLEDVLDPAAGTAWRKAVGEEG